MTLSISRPGKGRGGHVSHFSERPHHNWVSSITAIHDLRQPLNANRPPSAHLHPSRCVLTTTPSAARRSTLARCVCNSRRRFWEEFVCEGTTASRIRHSHFDISIPSQLSLSVLVEPPHMNSAAFLLLLEANL